MPADPTLSRRGTTEQPAPDTVGRPELPLLLGLAAIIVLATLLRFWRLGQWGLEGDEVFTARDSIHPQLDNPRPLLFFLNYYVVRPFFPLNELGLRVLPALCGVLAVPAVYLLGRRLVGARAALLAGLLIAVNPLHIYLSQYARYWSLVFLFSTVFPLAVFLGLRDRRPWLLALGAVTAVLAVLAHPTALLAVGGLGLWLVLQIRREDLRRWWGRRGVRLAVGVLAVLALVAVIRYVPIVQGWVRSHDSKSRLTDHLLTLPAGVGVLQAGILLSFLEGLTLPLVLCGMVGWYLLWLGRDRALSGLLVCLATVPVAAVLLLSLRTSVGRNYMLSSAPALFLAAGVFLDRLAALDWELRPRWLLASLVTALVIASGAPSVVSQYRDGRRQDFRGAATWLGTQLTADDVLYSDQFRTMSHYLPGRRVEHLTADPTELERTLGELHQAGRGGRLWIVIPYSARGSHRTTAKLGGFKAWIYANCQLREALGVARLDFRVNELQIFRCPPAVDAPGVPTAGR